MKRKASQRKTSNRETSNRETTRAELRRLDTEKTNSASADLDRKSALEIARIINREDAKVAAAVKGALPQIAQAIDLIAAALSQGGRMIYVGTGTSGRIAALDAVECSPTFDVDPRTVQFIIAGGSRALGRAVEADEDSRELGRKAIAKKKPTKKDVVVGIAASGRTPFTIAAIEYARAQGAKTVAVVCNPKSQLGKAAHVAIVADAGAEVVAGSTRMKAGTAQKMILNMLSTGAMTRLGYVYGNLMVNLHTRNEKLIERGVGILEKAAGLGHAAARKLLAAAGGRVPVALVMAKAQASRAQAEAALKHSQGQVREAIKIARTKPNGCVGIQSERGSQFEIKGSNRVKVHFQLEPDNSACSPTKSEFLWCIPTKRGSYIVDNIPFFARDISLGDEISAEQVEKVLHFSRVLHESKNSTVRVLLKKPGITKAIRDKLHGFGCGTELMDHLSLLAVTMPPDSLIAEAFSFLDNEADKLNIGIEESAVRYQSQ